MKQPDLQDDLSILKYVQHQVEKIKEYLANYQVDDFLNDHRTQDACILRIEKIGEYSNRVTKATKQRFPNIEWQLLKDTRNYFAHQYASIDELRVWEMIQQDLPLLNTELLAAIDQMEKERA